MKKVLTEEIAAAELQLEKICSNCKKIGGYALITQTMICPLLNALPGIKELLATVNHVNDEIGIKSCNSSLM